MTGGSYWSFKRVSTFFDLWERWRGAHRSLTLNGAGKECHPEAEVLSTHGQHVVPVTHSGCPARGGSENLPGPQQQVTPDDGDEIRELEALRPSTQHGPLNQPDLARGLRHAAGPAGPPTRSGRVNARARKPVDWALLFSLPRLLTHRTMILTVKSNEYYGT